MRAPRIKTKLNGCKLGDGIIMDDNYLIWDQYKKTQSVELKNTLILEYAPLVKYLAGRLSVHIGHKVDSDDLVSYGIFGLIDAIDKFDHEKGLKFETYASLRIRGAIIDHIRKMDWVPRDLRQKNKLLEKAYAALEMQLGREPTEEELSVALDLSLTETKELIKKAAINTLVSLDDYLGQNYEENSLIEERLSENNPEIQYNRIEVKETLEKAIEKLMSNENRVVSLYYFEDLTLKEISVLMSISESRVSQIHSKAVLKLRARLGKYKDMISI